MWERSNFWGFLKYKIKNLPKVSYSHLMRSKKKTTMIIEPKIKMIRSFLSFWPFKKLWPLCASKKVSPCWYICHTFKYQKWSAINPCVIHSCQLLIEEVFSPIFLNISRVVKFLANLSTTGINDNKLHNFCNLGITEKILRQKAA